MPGKVFRRHADLIYIVLRRANAVIAEDERPPQDPGLQPSQEGPRRFDPQQLHRVCSGLTARIAIKTS